MEPSRARRLIKIVVAALVGAALLVGGFFAWVVLFLVPDEPPGARISPPDGAVVQRSRVTFIWPDDDTPAWRFALEDEAGQVTFTQTVKGDRVTLPYGVLAPGRQYRWDVFRVDENGRSWVYPSISRRFSTAGAVTTPGAVDPITLFPDRIVLTRENLTGGLAVEVKCRTRFTVKLPSELVFPDGDKEYTGMGSVILYPLFDLARADKDPRRWGFVRVETKETSLQAPLVPDSNSLGSFVASWDAGFDLYADTPSFANYSSTWLSSLTQGTCVGIVLVVKLFFERVRFGEQPGIPAEHLSPLVVLQALVSQRPLVYRSSVDFRDLSRKDTRLITELMSMLHFENLNPLNLKETVFSVVQNRDSSAFDLVQEELTAGALPVLAGFSLRKKVVKAPGGVRALAMLDSGHTFVVFKGWEFSSLSLYAVYDPNREYEPERPGRTMLVCPSGEEPRYYQGSRPDNDMVRFMPVASSRLFTFIAVAAEGVREAARSLWRSFEDLSTLLSP